MLVKNLINGVKVIWILYKIWVMNS